VVIESQHAVLHNVMLLPTDTSLSPLIEMSVIDNMMKLGNNTQEEMNFLQVHDIFLRMLDVRLQYLPT
jgi:hypothetical protein